MMKKLSAYWWCQIGGWTFNAVANIINGKFNPYSWSYRNVSADIFFLRLLIITLLGIALTHFMRQVIIRLDILQKKFNYQLTFFLIITMVFAIIYSFSSLGIFEIFNLLRNNETTFTFLFLMYGATIYSFIVLLVWNLIYFMYHNVERVRKQQIHLLQHELEQRKKGQQLAELQKQKTELEMQALRAQMNPHFIFNSLNAINRFILQNNKAQASEYLTKFSRLIRLILQNSQETLIPLESELQALHLYLEMETLRFDDQFEYKIQVNDDIDASIIKVPPLFIQPYAENAIWHGLMHKEERGHLEIELSREDQMLCCRITDDGIGRKKAVELKSKSAYSYKSLGMRLTADRIAMLQQKQMKGYIEVTDLMLPDSTAGGTEVLIKIPLNYD